MKQVGVQFTYQEKRIVPHCDDTVSSYDACARKHHTIVRVTKFPSRNNHIEYRIGGYMERAIELSGGKTQRVQVTASMNRGQSYTEYDINWN